MTGDANWYEAAFVVGVTNALNVTADGLIAPDGKSLLSPPERASAKVASVYEEIRRFYDFTEVPLVFRVLALDALYLAEFWQALQHAFCDNHLSRRFKEALAFAVSLTTRSAFGTPLHLQQMRRFGVGDRGVMEIIGVTQTFSSYTKIADTLQLEPDMGDIAPVDSSPPPGSGS